ncbi:hypothetical protein CGGC5_v011359 [Colletotrichum fructicola Nara gc5]|uniref:Uncharacterized protein n=1 Tax=Colletotrichum fructicola (strain Nara gc5) TaxID=1213859 RepID=A0A7J6IWZ3_COLFN|nr:hypothetical protein CGGC5_v011359 [Colletotrichum fructicola Nara gc5]
METAAVVYCCCHCACQAWNIRAHLGLWPHRTHAPAYHWTIPDITQTHRPISPLPFSYHDDNPSSPHTIPSQPANHPSRLEPPQIHQKTSSESSAMSLKSIRLR